MVLDHYMLLRYINTKTIYNDKNTSRHNTKISTNSYFLLRLYLLISILFSCYSPNFHDMMEFIIYPIRK